MIAGVDGCKDKWISAVDLGNGHTEVKGPCPFVGLFEDRSLNLIVIDIPIGLPDKGSREADVEARRFLGKRHVVVFPAPIRPILDCSDRDEASRKRFEIEEREFRYSNGRSSAKYEVLTRY